MKTNTSFRIVLSNLKDRLGITGKLTLYYGDVELLETMTPEQANILPNSTLRSYITTKITIIHDNFSPVNFNLIGLVKLSKIMELYLLKCSDVSYFTYNGNILLGDETASNITENTVIFAHS